MYYEELHNLRNAHKTVVRKPEVVETSGITRSTLEDNIRTDLR
jgi:predicted DNA-binding transcriptional regulator AlpA